jgi:hypothetical protein
MIDFLNSFRFPIHLFFHVLFPYLFSIKAKFPFKTFWLLFGTMLVDIDHLLATPLLDPNRCSIGFHPLHSYYIIPFYGIMCLFPLLNLLFPKSFQALLSQKIQFTYLKDFTKMEVIFWIGLGLVIHMVLDFFDCLWMKSV